VKRRALLLSRYRCRIGARAQSGLWPEWLGSLCRAPALLSLDPARGHLSAAGQSACRRRRSTPFAVYFSIRAEDGGTAVWLRIDGGPMQTAFDGETLRFGPMMAGVAKLVSAQARPEPRVRR
jgi:hypothetical protein